MNDLPPADAVRIRMQQLRCEIDGDMEDMAASARSMIDWKHYVKTHPWVCLGTAATVGFLVVPERSTAIHSDLAAPDRVGADRPHGRRTDAGCHARMGRWAIGDRRQHRGSQGNRLAGAKRRKIIGNSGRCATPPTTGYGRRFGSRTSAGLITLRGHLNKGCRDSSCTP
jgi:hypothetical protein